MVALHNLMPSHRSAIERYLDENPELVGLVERFEQHVHDTYPDAQVDLRWVLFDEWEPPLLLQATVAQPKVGRKEDWDALDRWLRHDPAADPAKTSVRLLVRKNDLHHS